VPLYEYRCTKCGHGFEKIQKFSDPHVTECPKCSGLVEQVISAPAVQFKGAGWYVTDYARKSGASSGNGNKSNPSSSAESKSETKSPEPAAKSDKK
jgi:putative FmdB family regulatory protein